MSTSFQRIVLGMAVATAGTLSGQPTLRFEPGLGASPRAVAEIVREGRATGLAQADFDGDGVPDLAISYRLGARAAVAVFRGEYAALYPHFPAGAARRQALGGGRVAPFDPTPMWTAATGSADFLAAGDFDADGRADLVWASESEEQLVFHAGDGAGQFAGAASRPLPGRPTALAALDLDLADGLPEIVVGVGDGVAPQVRIHGGPQGAWWAEARGWALAAPVQFLFRQRLDEDGLYDLVLGGEGSWQQVRGTAGPDREGPVPLAEAPLQAPAALPMRLDDNAMMDFVAIGADGKVRFEIHGPALIFTVNDTDTSSDGTCDAVHCSLREAILAANAAAAPAAIHFDIGDEDFPPYRIQPSSNLPASLHPLTIDGSTQPGFAGRPIVEIYGGTFPDRVGLRLNGPSSTVRSLVVNGFRKGNAHGIEVNGADTTIEGCYLGTRIDGLGAEPNLDGLVFTAAADRARIGGRAPGAGNLISGQNRSGLAVLGDEALIEGNILGLDRNGNAALGGNLTGLKIAGAASVVGGASPGAGNLISGNAAYGLVAEGAGHLIQGNRIGTDTTGELARPNGIEAASLAGRDLLFGGTVAAARNLVSGNTQTGLLLGAETSRVENNFFGVSASGQPLGNGGAAILLQGRSNRIGSELPAGGNLIANNHEGIRCLTAGAGPLGTRIFGNSIFDNTLESIACADSPVFINATAGTPEWGQVFGGQFQAFVPSQVFRVEYFHSATCPMYSAAQTLIGTQNVRTDLRGRAHYLFQTFEALPAGFFTVAITKLPLDPLLGDTYLPRGISHCMGVPVAGTSSPPAVAIFNGFPGSPGRNVLLPLVLTPWATPFGAAKFAVDLGACVRFDPIDADADGLPDNVRLHLPAGWNAAVSHVPSDGDGELKFDLTAAAPILPPAGGTFAEIILEVTCSSPTLPLLEPVLFERSPAPVFRDTAGQIVEMSLRDGSIEIAPGLRGDCDGNGSVAAADVHAAAIEIHDGDSADWYAAGGGTYPGSPVGCDGNADEVIDAGDLSCGALMASGIPCAAAMPPLVPAAVPRLGTGLPAERGGQLVVPVILDPAGHDLTAAAFIVRLSSGTFDPADNDADGVPDAVELFHEGSLRSVVFRPPGTLYVALADVSLTPRRLAGKLLEITVNPNGIVPPAYIVEVESYSRSFGSVDGRSVSAGLEPGLFLDGFESGTLGAWSRVLP